MTKEEDTKLRVIDSLIIIDIIGYSLVLAFALYNTWVFLVMHGKAKVFLVTMFYVLVFTICVARIIDCIAKFNVPVEADPDLWYMNIVAFYAKAVMGIFQMASMSELTIQVKFLAQKITKTVANFQLKWLYIATCFIALIYCGVGVYDIYNYYLVVIQKEKTGKELFDLITPSVLFSIAGGLTISVIALFINLKLYFPHNLKDEKRRVKTIFIVYTVAFLTRAVMYLL